MANYPPPTEDLPIFDPTMFQRNDIPLTIAEGLNYFLAFPIAQGAEEIGDLTVGNSGICPTMPLVPPDNSLHMANTTWVQQYITGATTGFAPINSPAFTGIPTVPTPAPSDNSQQIPNTSWVRTYATSTFQTLSGMSLYALLASPIFSGTPTTPSPIPLDNSLQIPNTSWVNQYITGSLTGYAPINSPVFTGDPQVPLPAPSNNSATIPSTSWVRTYASSTYQTIADMSLYLTIASASATYLTIANAASTYLTIANAAATYQTIAGMSSYLTIANAAATYQTIAGMSSYLTISVAAATYQTLAGMVNYALLASPTFTGIPAAPLPTPANNNTSQIATCAWVNTAISSSGGGDAYLAGGTIGSPQTFTGYDAFSNNITTGGVPVGRGATNQVSNSVLGVSALNTTTTNVINSVAVGYQALISEVGSAGTPIYTIASITLNSGGFQPTSPINTTTTGPLIFSGGSPTVAATGTFTITTSAINTVIIASLSTGGSGYLSTPIISCDFSAILPPGCIDILNPSFVAPVITPFMSQTGVINTSGNGSTAVGTTALVNQNGANFNTALGYAAGNNITTGSYNTCIGYNSVVPVATADNQIAIGNQFSTTFIRGQTQFLNYPPLSPYVPSVPDALTNKTYVDSLISGGGYASLTANQTFTGSNQFSNVLTQFGLYNANPVFNTLTEFSSQSTLTYIAPDATNPNRSFQIGAGGKLWSNISINASNSLTLNGTTNQIYNSFQYNMGTDIVASVNLSTGNIAQHYNFNVASNLGVVITEPDPAYRGLVVAFRRYVGCVGNITIYTPLSIVNPAVLPFLPLNSITPANNINTAGVFYVSLICDGTYWMVIT